MRNDGGGKRRTSVAASLASRARPARAIIATLAALALAAALPASALAAPTWLGPTDLTAPGQNAGHAEVAVDAVGDAVAVWLRSDGSDYILQAATRPAGGAWGAPVEISAPGENAEDPHVAIDAAGEAVAVWSRYDGSNTVVEAATGSAGGAWGAPVPLSAAGRAANEPEVAVDPAGEAVAVWQSEGPSHYVIQAASRLPGGAWREPVDISLETENAYDAAVAIDGAGDAVATWSRFDGANYIVQAASRPAGGVWQDPVSLSAAGANAEDPHIAMDPAGAAVAVWGHFDGTNWRIQGAGLALGGTWSSPEDLSAAGSFAERPAVAIDASGNAVAIWECYDGTNFIIQAASRPAGGVWQEAVSLSASGESGDNGAVAISPDGNAVAVWQLGDGASEIVQASTRPLGGSWGAPENLSAPGHEAYSPQGRRRCGGDAVAVWPRDEGTPTVIQADAYDAAGPQLRGLSIPATGTAGVPLSFAVSPLDVWSALGATTWSFGDGAAAAGTTVSHTFAAPGTYAVKVTGVDVLGNASTATGTVAVAAPPALPIAHKGRSRARAARILTVKGHAALLALTCRGGARCTGTARLVVPGKRKPTAIGKATFGLAAGRHKTIKLPLTKKGRALVATAGRKGLEARLRGSGVVSRAVVLKPAVRRHRHRRRAER